MAAFFCPISLITLQKTLPRDGAEWVWPIGLWMSSWPKTSNNNGLMFLRNMWFNEFSNSSWHSDRHFP